MNDLQPKQIFPTGSQQSLPYATASLVLGILSIVFCFTYGILGLILGIIGLVLASKDRSIYRSNPEGYSYDSYKNSNAGRTCAIIGVILSSLFFLFFIGIILFGLAMATTVPFIHH